MAFYYIPADGGPRALDWSLGSSFEEDESPSIAGPTGGPRSEEVHAPALRVLPNAVSFACFRRSSRARRKNSMSFGFDHG